MPPSRLAAQSDPAPEAARNADVIVVVGAEGEPDYGSMFARWASQWQRAAAQATNRCLVLGEDGGVDRSDLEHLTALLQSESIQTSRPLWLVLIGHGTYDGREAKFNLRGPDLTASALVAMLKPVQRPLVVVNCASASGAFLPPLSASNRVVITSCRSGYEQNFARFGGFLPEALTAPAADLDRDGQTSLLEAFLFASHQVARFYETEGRLATEHALVDDNGDGAGTPADWFRGIRATKTARDGATPDGARAHQLHLVPNDREQSLPRAVREERDRLELALERLRARKQQMSDGAYYQEVELILLALARLYDGAGLLPGANPP
jgi:hypothetical protein